MGKAPSLDLRRRVAAAVVGGEPVRSVAARFQVSVASAVRLGQKLRAGADLTPAKRGGPRPSPITAAVGDWLRARLVEKPDLTMRALAGELGQQGTSVMHDTVWRFVRRQGLTPRGLSVGGMRDGFVGGHLPSLLRTSRPPAPCHSHSAGTA